MVFSLILMPETSLLLMPFCFNSANKADSFKLRTKSFIVWLSVAWAVMVAFMRQCAGAALGTLAVLAGRDGRVRTRAYGAWFDGYEEAR